MAPETLYTAMASGRWGKPAEYMPKFFAGQDQQQAHVMIHRFRAGFLPEGCDVWGAQPHPL